MYRMIDLTLTLSPGQCIYAELIPTLPDVQIEPVATVAEHGFSTDVLRLPTLAGTYLETSAHLFPDGPALEEIPPLRFVQQASVIQLPDQPANAVIDVDLLQAHAPEMSEGDAILIATGWESHRDQPDYVTGSPHLTRAAAEWLVAFKPPVIGGDLTANDDHRDPQGVNQVIFGSGALLLAPLINLREINGPRVSLFALPLKVAGTCGAPCRALAMEHAHPTEWTVGV